MNSPEFPTIERLRPWLNQLEASPGEARASPEKRSPVVYRKGIGRHLADS